MTQLCSTLFNFVLFYDFVCPVLRKCDAKPVAILTKQDELCDALVTFCGNLSD